MSAAADPTREAEWSAMVDAARRANPYDVASPYVTWDKRKSRPGDHWACCPFHQEKSASFHVLSGKGIFKCFGCGAGGDVIALDMKLTGDNLTTSVTRLSSGKMLLPDADAKAALKKRQRDARIEERREFEKGCANAQARWEASSLPDLQGPVRAYLGPRSRGISPATIALVTRCGGAIREDCGARDHPSMVAAAHNTKGVLCAVQFTPVRRNGSGRWGRRDNVGRIKSAAVRLMPPTNGQLAIAEGVESALAYYDLRHVPVWATLGVANLMAFEPPADARELVIAADGDQAGLEAAEALFRRLRDRVRVVIAAAPAGLDWADVLASQRRGAHVTG